MRRLGAAVLAIVLCILVGCGGDAGTSDVADSQAVGSYSSERDLTDADKVLFDKVMGMVAGDVGYAPLKVATQVVAGMNYRFYAKATVESNEPDPETYYVYVYVFVPLDENAKPEVTEIVKTQ